MDTGLAAGGKLAASARSPLSCYDWASAVDGEEDHAAQEVR
jgi:hypothetical protein